MSDLTDTGKRLCDKLNLDANDKLRELLTAGGTENALKEWRRVRPKVSEDVNSAELLWKLQVKIAHLENIVELLVERLNYEALRPDVNLGG